MKFVCTHFVEKNNHIFGIINISIIMIFTKKMRSMCRKKIRAGTLSGCWYLCLNPLPRQGQPEKIQIHKDEDKYTKTNTREIQQKISGAEKTLLCTDLQQMLSKKDKHGLVVADGELDKEEEVFSRNL